MAKIIGNKLLNLKSKENIYTNIFYNCTIDKVGIIVYVNNCIEYELHDIVDVESLSNDNIMKIFYKLFETNKKWNKNTHKVCILPIIVDKENNKIIVNPDKQVIYFKAMTFVCKCLNI